MRLIDVHCHIFPEHVAGKVVTSLQEYYGFTWEGNGLYEDILRNCELAGVGRCVVFSSATKPEQVESINNYIKSVVDRNPGLFMGLGTMHPDYAGFEQELHRIRSMGLPGVKIHPDFQQTDIDDPRMMKIYRCAAELGLVFLFHVGDQQSDFSAPRRLARVLDEVPGLRVIAAHLGGYSQWEEAKKYLIGRDLYMDISSSVSFLGRERSRELIFAHGTDKILFASDYPAVTQKSALRDFLELGLSAEDMEKIAHLNAERLFPGI